jgi:hypothetical protein
MRIMKLTCGDGGPYLERTRTPRCVSKEENWKVMPSSNRLWGVLAARLLTMWCGSALADPLFEDEPPKTFAEGFIQAVGLL